MSVVEPPRRSILPRKPPYGIFPLILEWMTSSSSSVNPSPLPGSVIAGLGVSRTQLDGFRSVLQDGERAYLDTMGFGEPQLLQDYFFISEPGTNNRVSRAVCVLYQHVFLLCRYVSASSIRSWDQISHDSIPPIEDSEKLFVYGYLYPRHIVNVTATRVGICALLGGRSF